ncbi:MAG: hypothetical protein EXR98_20185 [Gemmataceae bacterium]|nr:hypothetical protein [Gemmataceae bacterium]
MNRTILFGLVGMVAAAVIVGCTKTEPGPKNLPDPKAAGDARAKYLLASEPAGAKGVKEIKQQAKDGDEVVVVGRIGGSVKPFTGRASFTIVDLSFKPCNEIEGDSCETPWDYCCDAPDELAKGKVLVKLVDAAGKTLPEDAKELLSIKELQTVVIQGQMRKGEDNSVSVVVNGIFIRKK